MDVDGGKGEEVTEDKYLAQVTDKTERRLETSFNHHSKGTLPSSLR